MVIYFPKLFFRGKHDFQKYYRINLTNEEREALSKEINSKDIYTVGQMIFSKIIL